MVSKRHKITKNFKIEDKWLQKDINYLCTGKFNGPVIPLVMKIARLKK